VFVVDTNVLVYAADASSPHHGVCRRLIESWRAGESAWYLTWGIVYEFLRVVTHPRVFKAPWTASGAWSFVEGLLESPSLRILSATGRHAAVAAEVMAAVPGLCGNLMHDAETAVLMREHGIGRIVTQDTDFHRFRFLERIDPRDVQFQ